MREECKGVWKRSGTAELNGSRFEINQLFADDIALVADSEEKNRLVSVW